MKQNKPLLSGLVLTGVLGLALTPGWSQTKSGEPSGAAPSTPQKQQGTSAPASAQREEAGTPSSKSQTGAGDAATGKERMAAPGAADMKKIQEALKDKGHDPGPIDGIVGRQTQKALREFQKANNLKVTGRVDSETAKALGVETGPMSKGAEPSGAPGAGPATKEPSRSSTTKGSESPGSKLK